VKFFHPQLSINWRVKIPIKGSTHGQKSSPTTMHQARDKKKLINIRLYLFLNEVGHEEAI